MTGLFYLASVKHTRRDSLHILWWGPGDCGYTPVLGRAGVYTLEAIKAHPGYYHNGHSTVAVPLVAVAPLCVPQPHVELRHGGRFYDTPGPVVDNTRENWALLLGSKSLAGAPGEKPRPMWQGRRQTKGE